MQNNSMTVLVTGAFGFVGHHLIPALRSNLSKQTQLIAVGHGNELSDYLNTRSVSLDITDVDAVNHVFKTYRPDCVFHLAALSSVQNAHNAARETFNVNSLSTSLIASAMREHVPGATMIFASTGEIYGRAFASGVALDEKAPVFPMNPYSRSKLAAETILQDTLSDICPTIALRFMNHTGAGQDERFVTSSFAAQIARIEAGKVAPLVKVGNLTAERDFLDVKDVIDAYILSYKIAKESEGFEVYNVTSGIPRSIASILDDLTKLSSVPFDVVEDPGRMRPSDIPSAFCDSSAFRAATGWEPQCDWSDTLEKVLNGWREHYKS